MGNKYVLNILKFAFAAGLIYWLSTSGKLDWATLGEFWSIEAFSVFAILVLINLVVNNIRWFLLLRAAEVSCGFWESMKLSLVGIFFNYAMPGGVGGDIVKAYYLRKSSSAPRSHVITSVLLDRIIGFAAMAIMAMGSLLTRKDLLFEDWKLRSIFVVLFGVLVGYLFLVAISQAKISQKEGWVSKLVSYVDIKGILSKLITAFELMGKNTSVFVWGLLLSFVSQSCLIAVVYYAANWTLGFPLDWSVVYFAVPLGMMAMAAPVAPAGIGVGQMALYSFFQYMNVSDPSVGSLGITIIQILLFFWGLLGCYFYLRMGAIQPVESQDA